MRKIDDALYGAYRLSAASHDTGSYLAIPICDGRPEGYVVSSNSFKTVSDVAGRDPMSFLIHGWL
jgi:hypothetical protein